MVHRSTYLTMILLKSTYLTLILLLVVPRSSPREMMRISPLLVLAMLVLSTPETMSRLLLRLYCRPLQ